MRIFYSWVQIRQDWASASCSRRCFIDPVPAVPADGTWLSGPSYLIPGLQQGALPLLTPLSSSPSTGLLPHHVPSLNLVLCFWLCSFQMFSILLPLTDPSGIFLWCTLFSCFYCFKYNNTPKVQPIF